MDKIITMETEGVKLPEPIYEVTQDYVKKWRREQDKYRRHTAKSILETKVITQDTSLCVKNTDAIKDIMYLEMDTVSALYYSGMYLTDIEFSHPGVLNFGSFSKPGGGFVNGKRIAQEEALCYESNLYEVLLPFQSVYQEHRALKTKGLYNNDIILTPSIRFQRGKAEPVFADVITSAAPNTKAALRNGLPIRDCQNAMVQRIGRVLSVAADNEIDFLILGAFGCGVFGNDPKFVAKAFNEFLNGKFRYAGIKHIVFAIPPAPSNPHRYDQFKEIRLQNEEG